MENTITPGKLFAAACLVYICSGIFCGIIRWLHMCKPYDQHETFSYPGRKQATFFFSAVVLQFPYLLNPFSEDVWLYIRTFGILYYPLCFGLLIHRYFRKEQLKNNLLNSFLFGLSFTLLGLILLLLHKEGLMQQHSRWGLWVAGAVSVLLTLNYIQVARWLKRKIDHYHTDNFSNEDDFPYPFARRSFFSSFFWIVAMWLIFLTGSRWLKFGVDIVCAFWMVFFLASILHPQLLFTPVLPDRNVAQLVEDEAQAEEGEEPQPDEDAEVDKAVRNEVIAIILSKFKEPHLQKPDVMAAVSFGNKKEANRFIQQVGYYNLVNMFRLYYAQLYKEAHSSATQEEIAEASGFTTRYAFYNARRKVEYINPDLVAEVSLDKE